MGTSCESQIPFRETKGLLLRLVGIDLNAGPLGKGGNLEKMGVPTGPGGAIREAEVSEQTSMLRRLSVTRSSCQQGLYLVKMMAQ